MGNRSSTESACGTAATLPLRSACLTGMPSTRTVPDDGVTSPSSVLSRVDFPEPLGPSSTVISPLSTASETESSARTGPRSTVRSAISTSGGPVYGK